MGLLKKIKSEEGFAVEVFPTKESIVVEDGDLFFEARSDGKKRRVLVVKSFLGPIHIGCHKISRQAWELIKKKIDGP